MLMNYVTFKEELRKEVIRLLPEDLEAHVEVETRVKINGKTEVLVIHYSNNVCASSCDLAQLHRTLIFCTIEEIAKQVVKSYLNVGEIRSRMAGSAFDSLSLDNLYLVVVNTLWNQDLLKEIPHREYLNLSVIYRICVSDDASGFGNVMVTNEIMKQLGVYSEDDLYQKALENTRNLFPYEIQDMRSVLKRVFFDGIEGKAMTEDEVEIFRQQDPDDGDFLILTNKRGIEGSSVLLYLDKLKEAANIFRSDTISVIPASRNEVIVRPLSCDIRMMEAIVRETNATEVAECDRLSDQFYIYDAISNTLKIAIADDEDESNELLEHLKSNA